MDPTLTPFSQDQSWDTSALQTLENYESNLYKNSGESIQNEILEGDNTTYYSDPFITPDSNSSENGTEEWQLSIDMQFNDGHVISIVAYSILIVVSALGNVTVLTTILRFRQKSSMNRINLFLLHLAIADLMVTFLMMPIEIGWASTVSWKAGDLTCRVMMFFRAFGLYLSGFILVCISFDRYFAVLRPLTIPEAKKRGQFMLTCAWIGSILCSLPQSFIFHVEKHPQVKWFEQCVTYNSFPSKWVEQLYNAFGFIFMYGFPLLAIIYCYMRIVCEIYKVNNISSNDQLRRSNPGLLGRAKIRTLKMTVVIVASFFLCWTPYNVMTLWYFIDMESAQNLDQRIQKLLFIFACTNSCVNPMIYGFFHIKSRNTNSNSEPPRVVLVQNNIRLVRIHDPDFKFRVRWKPRGCLCTVSSASQSQSSSMPPIPNQNHCNHHKQQDEERNENLNDSDGHICSTECRCRRVANRRSCLIQHTVCIHGHIEPHNKCSHCKFLLNNGPSSF